MLQFIQFIQEKYHIQAIPVRIKNEKRWESMDELIDPADHLEGIPQNVSFDDGFGVVLYSFDFVSEEVKSEIKQIYKDMK